MVGGSTLVIHNCRKVCLDAVQWRDTYVSAYIHHYAYPGFVTTLLVYENKNNGDKLDRRKSMWTVDENQ